jgi:hypothetical protein
MRFDANRWSDDPLCRPFYAVYDRWRTLDEKTAVPLLQRSSLLLTLLPHWSQTSSIMNPLRDEFAATSSDKAATVPVLTENSEGGEQPRVL